MSQKRKYIISVFLIWLFTISGIIGLQSVYRDWFLALTPLDLIFYLIIIVWNSQQPVRLGICLLIPFVIGFCAELLGVHFGWIFGTYAYGNSLGIKFLEVPLVIGINWATLVYCTAAIVQYLTKNSLLQVFGASLLMVFLDFGIEISAPQLDFWEFKDGIVPLQNYLGWFGTSLLAHYIFQKLNSSYNIAIAAHIYAAIALFFTSIYLLS